VANMTFLGLALLLPHSDAISAAGLFHNLIPVTLGNIAGGGLFVGSLYWFVNARQLKEAKKQPAALSADLDSAKLSK